ncbi:MAG TPA: hypothetical protein VNE63_08245 [Candidatus Acidoferrales bacterium]|nr:hypothetical protein [Candidatus Acidoferrales bacterium]
MRKLMFMMAFLIVALPAAAKDIYIAQRAAGAANGADCADAYAYTFFNTSANWGAGASQIGPGTTVHICGTLTGAAGAAGLLTFQGSGTSGNPITLRFESGAIITAPFWGNGAIVAGTNSFIVIDGVCTARDSAGRCTATQGTIEASLAGSTGLTCLGGPCTDQPTSGVGLNAGNCSNCEVKNLTVEDMYMHSASIADAAGGGDGMWVGGTNTSADNNIIHDVHWGITGGFFSNESYFNNNLYNLDHGIAVLDSGVQTMSGLLIYNNLIRDFSNWDSAADTFHHDGIHVGDNSASTINPPWMIYNNYVYGDWGANDNTGIWTALNTPGSSAGVHYVFNNVFAPASGSSCANGAYSDDSFGTGPTVFNNTFAGIGCGILIGANSATSAVVENNIFDSGGAIIDPVGGSTISTSNFNDFYNIVLSNQFRYSTFYNTLAAWNTATGFDANSISTNPNLNATFIPNIGSPVIGFGVNFNSTCNGQANPGLGALCYDQAGVARPSTGNWTMGAYTSSSVAGPTAPANLTASVQ